MAVSLIWKVCPSFSIVSKECGCSPWDCFIENRNLRNWTWLLPLLLIYLQMVSPNLSLCSVPITLVLVQFLIISCLNYWITWLTGLFHPILHNASGWAFHKAGLSLLPAIVQDLSAPYLPQDKGWMGLTNSFRVGPSFLPISPSPSLPPTLHFLLSLDRLIYMKFQIRPLSQVHVSMSSRR